jgi:hypothetical protein
VDCADDVELAVEPTDVELANVELAKVELDEDDKDPHAPSSENSVIHPAPQ